MKKELKVGDMAVAYMGFSRTKGTIIYVNDTEQVLTLQSEGVTYVCSYKQCRRLIKRKKKKVVPRFVGWARSPLLVIKDRVLVGEITDNGNLSATGCAVFIIDEKELTPEIRTKWRVPYV